MTTNIINYAIITTFILMFVVLAALLSPPVLLSPTAPAKPYLNTSHSPVFTPYLQNTSIWLTINGSVYQYWASLDNFASGSPPCILTMSAVKNGSITHTLNKTEANATLASVQIFEASGTSPSQPEYADPVSSYYGLSVCSNYTNNR